MTPRADYNKREYGMLMVARNRDRNYAMEIFTPRNRNTAIAMAEMHAWQHKGEEGWEYWIEWEGYVRGKHAQMIIGNEIL